MWIHAPMPSLARVKITVCLEYNSKNSMGGYTGYLKDTCEYRTDMQIVLSLSLIHI